MENQIKVKHIRQGQTFFCVILLGVVISLSFDSAHLSAKMCLENGQFVAEVSLIAQKNQDISNEELESAIH